MLRNMGRQRTREGALELKFGEEPEFVPAELLFDPSIGRAVDCDSGALAPELFADGDTLFYRGVPHYGALATVLHSSTDAGKGAARSLAPAALCSCVSERGLTAQYVCSQVPREAEGAPDQLQGVLGPHAQRGGAHRRRGEVVSELCGGQAARHRVVGARPRHRLLPRQHRRQVP